MVKPSVKATEALEKAPAAKPLRSRSISDENPKLRVNVSYNKLPKQFFGKDWFFIILTKDNLYFQRVYHIRVGSKFTECIPSFNQT
jgi:hypothetical protein